MKPPKKSKPSEKSPPSKLNTVGPESLQVELGEIRQAVANRAYELFERRGGQHGRDLEDWFRAENEFLSPAPLVIFEDENSLSVRATVFGFEKEELKTSIEPRRLTIVGRKRTAAQTNNRAEHRTGEIHPTLILRVLDLPAAIDPSGTVIQFADGVLSFELPKALEGETSAGEQAA